MVAALMFVLASPLPSAAECAWVVWAQGFRLDSGGNPIAETIQPQDGYASQAECETARDVSRRIARERKAEMCVLADHGRPQPKGGPGASRAPYLRHDPLLRPPEP